MKKMFMGMCVGGLGLLAACGDDDTIITIGPDACIVEDSGRDAMADSGHDANLPLPDSATPDASEDAGWDSDVPSCGEDAGDSAEPFEFTEMERLMLDTLSPLPEVPADPTNRYADNEDAAELGQAFFFDKRFSGGIAQAGGNERGAQGEEDKLACASCHNGAYLDDQETLLPRRVSVGSRAHSRNAPTAINSVFYQWTNWGGRFSAPWELPIAVVESPAIMNGSRLEVAHIIYDNYRDQYEAVFGDLDDVIDTLPASGKPNAMAPGAWEMDLDDDQRAIVNRVLINFGKAIEAYERLLVSRNAPFDRMIAETEDASEEAKRGARLFLGKARCINCHNGPLLSDNEFHNLGVPQSGIEGIPTMDLGRSGDVPGLLNSPFNSGTSASDDTTTGRLAGVTNPAPAASIGAFRTPGLRGVALTAPYMHSGQFDTLEQVIEFYNLGGGAGMGAQGKRDALLVPLLLTTQEKSDLKEFLLTLTGDPIAAPLLVDTSAPL